MGNLHTQFNLLAVVGPSVRLSCRRVGTTMVVGRWMPWAAGPKRRTTAEKQWVNGIKAFVRTKRNRSKDPQVSMSIKQARRAGRQGRAAMDEGCDAECLGRLVGALRSGAAGQRLPLGGFFVDGIKRWAMCRRQRPGKQIQVRCEV